MQGQIPERLATLKSAVLGRKIPLPTAIEELIEIVEEVAAQAARRLSHPEEID